MKVSSTYAWDDQSPVPLVVAIEKKLEDYVDPYEGQLERTLQQLEAGNKLTARLASALVEKGYLTLADIDMGEYEIVEEED